MEIIVISYIFSLAITWQFVGYPILMALIAIRYNPGKKDYDYSYQPFISILVPTYNEEIVIENRIKNLLNLNYPKDKYEIIIVDSGSTDTTVKIAENYVSELEPNLMIIEEKERKGKASAINTGKMKARGDIILVTDANSIFDNNALREIAPQFKNQNVGGVGGRYIVKNTGKTITDSTQFYWDIEYIMRKGERVLDSACTFHGEINAWRKNLIDADEKQLTEDLDMAVQIKKKGFKIEYIPDAVVYESAPTTTEEQIKQRKRTSIGTIQCICKHWKYFLFPKDWYSMLIFPSHKGLAMFSPFILILIVIFNIAEWNLYATIQYVLISLIIFGCLFYILMRLKYRLVGTFKVNKRFSIRSIPQIAHYVMLNEYLILLAWKDFIFKKYSILWDKVDSTRN